MKSAKKPMPFQLLKVGADVEMFIRRKDTAELLPCVGIVGGTKYNPLPLPGLGEGFACQEDNVMYEFNIPPALTSDEFVNNIGLALNAAKTILEPKGLEYLIQPSAIFKPEQLLSKQARHIGCEPDFNVWERQINEIVGFPPGHETLRTSGGHIHVSFLVENRIPTFPKDVEAIEAMIMAMDIFLGVPFTSSDRDTRRRILYGKAGAFRPKDYGIEYRVLSNHWISSPAKTAFVFQQVQNVFNFLNNAGRQGDLKILRKWKESVIKGINFDDDYCRQNIMDSWRIAGVPNG